ncbi:hypothetical protein Peur_061300 [Populus x canadensis]
MRAALMWTINDFLAYGMISSWSTHGKLACPYCMENNKAFTVTNRVEKDVAPPYLFGEELHDVVSEYGDIVFGFQSSKQKFPGFSLTYNWVK